ncbi:MAG: HlyD family efflux transporter periplasmic adaptor subunit [Oscillospiraceae bacterium]|nr:HlyD family efflux transporter periplasmic adaptor subunit [Oscillospiraceae bacterium]
MKRTDTLTKIISFLLFAALLAYLGVYVIKSTTDNIRMAPAVFVSLSDNAAVSGLVVRQESLIQSSEKYLSVVAENGKEVAVGETVAVIYSGEESLARAAKIRELELKKQYISSVLSGKSSAESLSDRDSSIRESLLSVASSAARHDTESLASATVSLGSLVILNASINTTEVDLNLVTAELESLKQSALSDTSLITASAPGLFSSSPDGYEYITPDMLSGLTVSKLAALEETPQEISSDVRGKLASAFEWYYAAEVKREDADRLEVGSSATLDFGRYCSSPLKATVISISVPENDECAVVFRCTQATSELLFVRRASAEIVFDAKEGLRVPKQAVLSDEDGSYVYTLTGMQAEKKYINIVWETDDYFLAEVSQEADALREGNDIILTTKGLSDGKILND